MPTDAELQDALDCIHLMPIFTLHAGDCRAVLPTISDASVDAVICDPPYPCIDRPYGRLTEAEWHDLMHAMVPEVRRVLKPTGSAVFILQPNYETPGRMRLWLWEFLLWAAREWNLVQDVYWWNVNALPKQGCQRDYGLLRSSVKYCVWLGDRDCFRDQDAVLWSESDLSAAVRVTRRVNRGIDQRSASRKDNNRFTLAHTVEERGGVTPYNCIPFMAGSTRNPSLGHGSPTPLDLCNWWMRYICLPGGTVLDPFCGMSTVGVAALKLGRSFIGIDKIPEYIDISQNRLEAVRSEMPLFDHADA